VEIARRSQPENTPLSDCTCPVGRSTKRLRQTGIENLTGIKLNSASIFPNRTLTPPVKIRVGLSHSVVTASPHTCSRCPAFGATEQKTRLTAITYSLTADSGGVGV
jgi:hypothetical protein